MNEHEIEPIRGLPERLPQGERILWQGAPDWKALALRALHVRTVLIYFALLFAWSVWAATAEGTGIGEALLIAARLVPVALAAAGILTLYAYLAHRTTVYTITNRRVVMRFGVALPLTVNIPFAIVGAAALKEYGDKTGDIPLTLTGTDRVSYFALWPNVRTWWTARPQPMLRAVPQAATVAAILADALAAAKPGRVEITEPAPEPVMTPSFQDREPAAA